MFGLSSTERGLGLLDEFKYEINGKSMNETRVVTLCKFLLDNGANPNAYVYNFPEMDGCTAIFMCALQAFSWCGIDVGSDSDEETISVLTCGRCNFRCNCKPFDSSILLQRRRCEAYIKCCQLLVEAGADVNAEYGGKNALMWAFDKVEFSYKRYKEDEGDDIKLVLQPGIFCLSIIIQVEREP
jgi:hypothetical protein